MVVLFHALAMVRIEEWLPQKIRAALQLVGNGNGGVAIFFVLSGYVLARSLDASAAAAPVNPLPETLRFAIRRVLRIWPAMAICLFACFVWVRFVFDPVTPAAASDDYSLYWRQGATWRGLLLDTLFVRSYLNPVTWTLAVEMIAAALFVPLWWINRRSRPAMLVLTAAWGAWFLATPHPSFTAFVFLMLLGVQIEPAARLISHHLGARATTVALGLSFLGTGLVMQYPRATSAQTWFVHGLFAYAIVALLVASEGRVSLPWLDHRAARFMGRISYSFYLWNFPVLYALTTFGFAVISADHWLQTPNVMAGVLFIVSALITIPVAWLSYRMVELPMIRLAKSAALRTTSASTPPV
jgi:peptidoglycan/LPS O-acetylase OafA/YrhL